MTRTSSSGDCASPAVAQGRSPEMTLYDSSRKAHKLLTDGTDILISPRSLDSELMCPICLDMLSVTMTTKECLHRFCSECITTALRNGNKECPTCRKKLVSKRSLRPDPNFDAIIARIYPDREEYDAIQERAFAKLSAHSSAKAFQESMEEGIKAQAQQRRLKKVDPRDFEYKKRAQNKKRKTEEEEDGLKAEPMETETRESSLEPSASEASAASHPSLGPVEVELILRPHPLLDANAELPSPLRATRYLKTTGNATVEHISEYVGLRVRLDTEECARTADPPAQPAPLPAGALNIYINPGIGSNKPFILLDGVMSLAEVRQRYWKVKRPLELQFALAGDGAAAPVPSPVQIQTGLFGSSGSI